MKKLVKAFGKEVVEKTGRHLFQIRDFDFDFSRLRRDFKQSRKMGSNPNFCSALPGFLYQKVRKESYSLDTIGKQRKILNSGDTMISLKMVSSVEVLI